jgi:hypothetical protein
MIEQAINWPLVLFIHVPGYHDYVIITCWSFFWCLFMHRECHVWHHDGDQGSLWCIFINLFAKSRVKAYRWQRNSPKIDQNFQRRSHPASIVWTAPGPVRLWYIYQLGADVRLCRRSLGYAQESYHRVRLSSYNIMHS